jgi:nitrate/TMAO reductase-like tetraheme cytochrome c subunit
MKKFFQKIKSFFLPPPGTPTWLRVLPYAVLGVITLILLTAAAYTWEYTNSPEFCGTSCHTMPPEYTAYLTSPHARIDCVDCHIGKGFIATRITRKAGDLKHVFRTMFKNYEFPIQAGELRPARETCELCHFPQKFSDDSLRKIRRYATDTSNTPTDIYLSLKTGGGSQRQGLGKGIHWHIENPVLYYTTDPEEQYIPYVRSIAEDGSITEYIDVEADFERASVNEAELKEMDCITCHNRITHLVATPEDTVDELIETGTIAADIPDIRRQAVEVYSGIFETQETGLNHISGLEGYYQTYYPEYYAENQAKILAAIQALKDAYKNSVYPEQNSSWNTHPNNIGHKDFPGCLRCHDGKHLDENVQAIRLECNLCHSIPLVAGQDDFVANLEISRGQEPESHLNANWISLHNQVIDENCQSCHTMEDAGGTSNTSFCSNSACHGSVWSYAGFDAPALREVLQEQLLPKATPTPLPEGSEVTYSSVIGAIFEAKCAACHAESGMKGLNVTTYASLMAGSESGDVVLPGDPDGSLLVQKQSSDTPHFGQLNSNELELVRQWIEAGALEN